MTTEGSTWFPICLAWQCMAWVIMGYSYNQTCTRHVYMSSCWRDIVFLPSSCGAVRNASARAGGQLTLLIVAGMCLATFSDFFGSCSPWPAPQESKFRHERYRYMGGRREARDLHKDEHNRYSSSFLVFALWMPSPCSKTT